MQDCFRRRFSSQLVCVIAMARTRVNTLIRLPRGGEFISYRASSDHTKFLIIFFSFFVSSLAVAQAPSKSTEREIVELFAALGSSGCEFNRNGRWYDAAQAVDHLQKKHAYLKQKGLVTNTELFIDRAASKSSMSGKPYLVRCANISPITSAEWFKRTLRNIRRTTEPSASSL